MGSKKILLLWHLQDRSQTRANSKVIKAKVVAFRGHIESIRDAHKLALSRRRANAP